MFELYAYYKNPIGLFVNALSLIMILCTGLSCQKNNEGEYIRAYWKYAKDISIHSEKYENDAADSYIGIEIINQTPDTIVLFRPGIQEYWNKAFGSFYVTENQDSLIFDMAEKGNEMLIAPNQRTEIVCYLVGVRSPGDDYDPAKIVERLYREGDLHYKNPLNPSKVIESHARYRIVDSFDIPRHDDFLYTVE